MDATARVLSFTPQPPRGTPVSGDPALPAGIQHLIELLDMVNPANPLSDPEQEAVTNVVRHYLGMEQHATESKLEPKILNERKNRLVQLFFNYKDTKNALAAEAINSSWHSCFPKSITDYASHVQQNTTQTYVNMYLAIRDILNKVTSETPLTGEQKRLITGLFQQYLGVEQLDTENRLEPFAFEKK